MFQKTAPLALAAALVLLAGAGAAGAQGFPGLGVGNLAAANLAFDQAQFNGYRNWCTNWYLDLQRYRRATGDMRPVQLPFNAGTISAATRAGSEAMTSYIHGLEANSNRAINAASRYSQQGILGYGNYMNPSTGTAYSLPNSNHQYWLDNYGRAWGTNTNAPPSYRRDYRPLYPVW